VIYLLSLTYGRSQTKVGVKTTCDTCVDLLIFITEYVLKEKSSYITNRRFHD